jgi:hypothetical protein
MDAVVDESDHRRAGCVHLGVQRTGDGTDVRTRYHEISFDRSP